jgi:hypothetical protein
MELVTKSVEAQVIPVDSESDAGEFEVILSTEGLDRDGENLWIKEWKQPLPARIHIDGDHGRTLEKTVGSAVPRIEGNRVIGKGAYASTEYAQMVRRLVNEGHIDKLSVTYGETKDKDGNIQRELFNAAFVAIPANPEAVVLSSKAFADEGKKAARDFLAALKQFGASGNNPVTHDGMVQAIHDAAYHLGAQCANEIEADSGKDEGANKSAALAALVKEGLLTKSEIREDFDLSKTSSTKSAGTPQESPDDSPAEAATKAAADAPAKVPAKAADDSADAAEALATSAKALEYLISKNFKEQ